jgi:5-methylcytosine-specific restriction enzyme subunit McrC
MRTTSNLDSLRLSAWSSRAFRIDPRRAQRVAETGLVSVELKQPPEIWQVSADSRVGIVSGSDWELRVEPRLKIPKLMFLLGYAANFGWEDVTTEVGDESDFFSAIANGFTFHARNAMEPSPLRGYVSVEEESYALQGRLRIADQIARSSGLPLPLQIAYDDHLPDVLENRMLKSTAELLLRLPRVPAETASGLRRIRATLEGVGTVPIPFRDKPPEINRLNKHYEAALALAALILKGSSITTRAGDITSVGFIFDMNKVFEDFLSATLTDALERIGGRVQLQYQSTFLDEERRLRLKPDITWWEGPNCRGIIDAKFKQLRDERFPNADAYQMLAYCTAFDLGDGFLVYAQDEEERPRDHRLRDGHTRIRVRTVNVERDPTPLLADIDALAGEIADEAMFFG